MTDEQRMRERLRELAELSGRTSAYYFTDFLAPADAALAYDVCDGRHMAVWGGYDAAERVMARFGSAEELGYEVDFPMRLVGIRPLHPKFAEKLTHRDYLGALMHLGIERDVLGDILLTRREGVAVRNDGSDVLPGGASINDKDPGCLYHAYAFVAERMADFICESLAMVRHTAVECAVVEHLPQQARLKLESRALVVASLRLDGVLAKLYHLSRSEAKGAFARQEVFRNGRLCANPSALLEEGDIISIRHRGKFVYQGSLRETKKGNMRVEVAVYV